MRYDTIVIGAGLSGLYAAVLLSRAGQQVPVLDRASSIGGRVQTDEHDGCLYDHGFQILLPAYPEAKLAFDYPSLDLRHFQRGARIFLDGKWETLVDPMDAPWRAMLAAFSVVGSLRDKLRVVYLRSRALKGTLKSDPSKTTKEYLTNAGFSEQIVENFFKPFLEGVFLDRALQTDSAKFAFYFSLFTKEGGAIPSGGMKALPEQLRAQLAEGALQLNTEVSAVQENRVILSDGRTLEADNVLVAVDEEALFSLMPELEPSSKNSEKTEHGTTCMYFEGPPSLLLPPILHLVPNSKNGISNIAPLSSVAREYAKNGNLLLSVNITHGAGFPRENYELAVKTELVELFGAPFKALELKKVFTVPNALPTHHTSANSIRLPHSIHLAGDLTQQGSINGALHAGKLAAEQILNQ